MKFFDALRYPDPRAGIGWSQSEMSGFAASLVHAEDGFRSWQAEFIPISDRAQSGNSPPGGLRARSGSVVKVEFGAPARCRKLSAHCYSPTHAKRTWTRLYYLVIEVSPCAKVDAVRSKFGRWMRLRLPAPSPILNASCRRGAMPWRASELSSPQATARTRAVPRVATRPRRHTLVTHQSRIDAAARGLTSSRGRQA